MRYGDELQAELESRLSIYVGSKIDEKIIAMIKAEVRRFISETERAAYPDTLPQRSWITAADLRSAGLTWEIQEDVPDTAEAWFTGFDVEVEHPHGRSLVVSLIRLGEWRWSGGSEEATDEAMEVVTQIMTRSPARLFVV